MNKPGPLQSVHPQPPPYVENMDQREPSQGVRPLPPPYAEDMDKPGPPQDMKPLPPGFASPPPYVGNMDKGRSPQNMKPLPQGFASPPPYTDGHKAPPMLPVFINQRAGYGPGSRKMTCSYCKTFISTRVKHESSTKTHLLALLVCLTGFWLCTPCVYCMDCLVKKHYCPKCNVLLGQCDH